MAQKDTIWGGIRGSSEPIRPDNTERNSCLVYLLLIALALGCIWALGGIK